MVRYRRKTPSEMREEYELRSESMTLVYGKKMGPERIKERGSEFEEGYKAIRAKVVEFLRGLLAGRRVFGQVVITIQNVLSETISAYKNLYSGTAYTHLLKCAQTLIAFYPTILTRDELDKIRGFLRENGVPEADIIEAFRVVGLPT